MKRRAPLLIERYASGEIPAAAYCNRCNREEASAVSVRTAGRRVSVGTIVGLNPGPEQEMLQRAYDEARGYYIEREAAEAAKEE